MQPTQNFYVVFADMVLVLHGLFVLFVIMGLVAVLLGAWRQWQWVRRPLWRWLHLGAIGIVVLQSWFGVICPLTTLEVWLRRQGGNAGYEVSFIQYWVSKLLYYQAPLWVFALIYTLFALLVVLAWRLCPPAKNH